MGQSSPREKQTLRLNGSPAHSAVLDWIGTLLKTFTVLMLVTTFCFRIAKVDGHSMETTLADTDRLIVTELYDYTPRGGDIIVISRGAELDEPLVKRVIAAAGQEIRLDYEHGAVYVDGEKLDEPYVQGKTVSGTVPAAELNGVIPEGKVFVMGDNREHSSDSRSYAVGLISESDIIGKVQLNIFPHSYENGKLKPDLSRFGSVYEEN